MYRAPKRLTVDVGYRGVAEGIVQENIASAIRWFPLFTCHSLFLFSLKKWKTYCPFSSPLARWQLQLLILQLLQTWWPHLLICVCL
ncbi:hypothetical protein ZEAMMB73_Zm00001d007401 [Zea mays]|uniref:Uncharacterized protein n=1 Tax=Zea mays TaxID=4577 RepID=A0A1D6F620_MAIZE|nr:hypothetical protein ZEAMMB73_Zm00001d007401 [Zea mays]